MTARRRTARVQGRTSRALAAALATLALLVPLAACGTSARAAAFAAGEDVTAHDKKDVKDIVVGFAAVGQGDDSMRSTLEHDVIAELEDAGMRVKYAATNNLEPAPQFDAVRDFADMNVDVILVTPIQAHTWEETLNAVHDQGIPVLMVDRNIIPNDTNLYSAHIGPSTIDIGRKAAGWAMNNMDAAGSTSAVVLEGPANASNVQGYREGWSDMLSHSTLTTVARLTCDWDADSAAKALDRQLDGMDGAPSVVFAHSDSIAAGAIRTLKAHGIAIGTGKGQTRVIAVGASKANLTALRDGDLSFVVDNPARYGQRLVDTVLALANDDAHAQDVEIPVTTYTRADAAEALKKATY